MVKRDIRRTEPRESARSRIKPHRVAGRAKLRGFGVPHPITRVILPNRCDKVRSAKAKVAKAFAAQAGAGGVNALRRWRATMSKKRKKGC